MRDRIVLVGFMGSGKTTVGGTLARLLGWRFQDMDDAIEEATGLTIAQIFEQHGEAYFRGEELRAARRLALLPRHVLAAGGGAFAAPRTRKVLRLGSVAVWLRCDLETVLARVRPDGSRPLAANRERMRKLFVERQSSYRLADVCVDASAAPVEVARHIIAAVFPEGPPRAARDIDR